MPVLQPCCFRTTSTTMQKSFCQRDPISTTMTTTGMDDYYLVRAEWREYAVFFRCCMFYCWAVVSVALHDLRTLVFCWNVIFALAPLANIRKQNLDSRNESERCAILTCQIGGSCFLRNRALYSITTATSRSFVCTKSICYVYNSFA